MVIPSRIELDGKVYYHETDLTSEIVPHITGWPKWFSFDEVSVLVKEKSSSLQIAFEVHGSDIGVHHKPLMFPVKTIQLFGNKRGLVPLYGS